jgi:hypothetical protein
MKTKTDHGRNQSCCMDDIHGIFGKRKQSPIPVQIGVK